MAFRVFALLGWLAFAGVPPAVCSPSPAEAPEEWARARASRNLHLMRKATHSAGALTASTGKDEENPVAAGHDDHIAPDPSDVHLRMEQVGRRRRYAPPGPGWADAPASTSSKPFASYGIPPYDRPAQVFIVFHVAHLDPFKLHDTLLKLMGHVAMQTVLSNIGTEIQSIADVHYETHEEGDGVDIHCDIEIPMRTASETNRDLAEANLFQGRVETALNGLLGVRHALAGGHDHIEVSIVSLHTSHLTKETRGMPHEYADRELGDAEEPEYEAPVDGESGEQASDALLDVPHQEFGRFSASSAGGKHKHNHAALLHTSDHTRRPAWRADVDDKLDQARVNGARRKAQEHRAGATSRVELVLLIIASLLGFCALPLTCAYFLLGPKFLGLQG